MPSASQVDVTAPIPSTVSLPPTRWATCCTCGERYLPEITSWGCDSRQVNSVYPRSAYGVVEIHRVEDDDVSITCWARLKPHDGDENLRVDPEGCLKVNVRLGRLSPNSQVSVTDVPDPFEERRIEPSGDVPRAQSSRLQ